MGMAHDAEYAEYVSARYSRLHRAAHLLCGDPHRADDLVQTTLLSLYLHWKRAVAADNLDAYVHRIMVRRLVDEHRRGWSRVLLPGDPPEQSVPVDDSADERDAMLRALRGLPRRQRAAIVLRYYADLSVEATAQALGCSVGTVKSHCSRGLASLRTALTETGGPPGPQVPASRRAPDAADRAGVPAPALRGSV
jgi:RNA polymerase sigma-70 factor (sigma-E family)